MKPQFVATVGAKVEQVQTDVLRAFQGIGDISGGTVIKGVAVRTTSTPVAHGMVGRPQGRVIIYQSGAASVWDSQRLDERYVYLQASVAVTVDLWIF